MWLNFLAVESTRNIQEQIEEILWTIAIKYVFLVQITGEGKILNVKAE